MKVKYFATTISSIVLLTLLASCSPGTTTTAPDTGSPATTTDVADPCAAKDPCAADPCAAKDPCAADPCAAKDPCAGASNPCAAKYANAVFVDNGVAIRGFDPVAYFTEGAPVEGSDEFAYEWQGATWHFSSAENRDKFASNPEEFAPQYGGYCAYAVSQGYTA